MKRYDFSHGGSALAGMPSRPDGEFVKYDDAQTTIARLTAELAQAQKSETEWRRKNHALHDQLAQGRAEAVAAYERAAYFIANIKNEITVEGIQISLDMVPLSTEIRALATEAETTALAEMLDAETRACIEASSNAAAGYRERQVASKGIEARDWESMKLAALFIRDLLTARIDQRKGAGE